MLSRSDSMFLQTKVFFPAEVLCSDALSIISANSLTSRHAFCVSNTIFEALKTQEEELQQAEDKLRQAGSGVWIYGEVLRTNLTMSDMQFAVPSKEHWKYCRVLHLAQEAKVISKNLDGETLERKAFLKFTRLVVNFRIREICLPLVT